MRTLRLKGRRNRVRPLGVAVLMALAAVGCTKREFNLTEDTVATGTLDPAFAVPLVHGTWTFQEVIGAVELPATMVTDAAGGVTAVFPFDVFESEPVPLVPLSEFTETTLELDDEQALALSLLPPGDALDIEVSSDLEVPLSDLTAVDSIWLGGGALAVQIQSALPFEISASGTCVNMLQGGEPLFVQLTVDASSGFSELLIPMSNTTLIGSGAEGLSLAWEWSLIITSTGEEVEVGEVLTLSTGFEDAIVTGAFGAFSMEEPHPIASSMALPELVSWDPALFYLSAPRLVLEVKNSFGVDLGFEISALSLLTGPDATPLQGQAVDAFPNLAGAPSVGDTAWTTHVFDNDGLEPDLSDLLNAAPDSVQLVGEVVVLPAQVGGQFATATDVLSCTGALEVPLAGWAKGVTWRDTLSAPISQELQAGVAPPLDWMDVATVTMRFIVNNGWSLQLNGSLHFINAAGDSLLAGPGLSIPGGDEAPAEATVDYVMDRALALELLEMDCAGVAVAWTLETTDADSQQLVQVYADDAMSMRVAAKVECEIDPSP